MAKQDVLDAINATIVPNGVKGINAQALNNVLTMMAENAGEGGGSGDGALRIMMPTMEHVENMYLELGGLFSPDTWAEVRTTLETQVPGVDLSEMDTAVSSMFAHNAAVAQQIIEKAKASEGVSVILDQSLYFASQQRLTMQATGQDALFEDFALSIAQPASCCVTYAKLTAAGEATLGAPEMFECSIHPCHTPNDNEIVPLYPESLTIILQQDGSIIIISSIES